jgi:protein tyrosine/serine phosphatase
MGFSTIVDLRRPSERALRPSRRWDGFAAALIEAEGEHEGDVVWESFIRSSDHSAASFRWYATQFYKSAPFAPRHVELFSRYFEALARAEGAILVHCAAGKDRTGMICALTHKLAGVHDDDMMADFLATNDLVRVDKIGPIWARDIAAQCGREPPLENLAVAMRVEPSYLNAAFGAICSAYGSIDLYLENALGVDAARRAKIEAKILV